MLRTLKVIIIISVCFVLSGIVANHFDGNKLTLDSLLVFYSDKSAQLSTMFQEVKKELLIEHPSQNVNLSSKNHHNIDGHSSLAELSTWSKGDQNKHCKDWGQGQIQFKKLNGVYSWLDESGQQHYGSVAPTHIAATEHDFNGVGRTDKFSLNITGDQIPVTFTEKINGKINRIFSLYAEFIGHNNLQKTALNLRFIKSKRKFIHLYNNGNSNAKNGEKTAGFYRSSNNQSTILVKNYTSSVKTAIHESVHGLNRSVIGYMPRWLNEGLAEYLEDINVVLQLGIIKANFNEQKSHTKFISLNTLFNATNKQWAGNLRPQLYNTSSAFVFYMMDDINRKNRFMNLLRAEQNSLCNQLPVSTYINTLTKSLPFLQHDFSQWLLIKNRKEHRI